MIKLFLKDSFIYTLSNLLTKGIGFLMLPVYTAFLMPKDFGVLDMLLITGNLLSIIIGLEIHQAVARFFPEATDFESKRRIVSTAFWGVLGLYFVFLLLTFFWAKKLSLFFFDSEGYSQLIQIALFSYGFNFMYYFASSQLRWQLKAKESLIVTLIYSSISAGGAYWLLKNSSLGVSSVFLSQIVAGITGLAVSFMMSREYYGFVLAKDELKRMLQFSLPLIFSTLTVYAMLYVDRLMINSMLKSEDLGYYAFAYRIASVVSLMTVGMQTALTPIIYNNYKNPQTPKQIANLFHIFLAGGSILILGLVFFSSQIVLLMSSEIYINAADLIPWIALSMLLTGVTNFTPGIFIEKKTHLILYINLVSFLLNILLGYVFIQNFGLVGAVAATAICSVFYFLMYYVIGQKYYFIPFFWNKFKR
jgi:O-antigen/teichoic acid export membrane protein